VGGSPGGDGPSIPWLRGLSVPFPPRPAVRLATIVLAPVAAAVTGAAVIGGPVAGLGVVMGAAAAGAVAIGAPPVPFGLAVTALASMGAAAGMTTQGNPLLAALVVLAAALAAAPIGPRAGAVAIMLPAVPAVFATIEVSSSPLEVAGWVLLGGLLMLAIARVLRIRQPSVPVPAPVARRHAAVTGLAAAFLTAGALWLDVPHGYWSVMTLCAVLRPAPGETAPAARDHAAGTAAGAVLAAVLTLVLPPWAALVAAAACGVLMLAWATVGDGRRQALFITPVVVLTGSAGLTAAALESAAGRVLLIAVGSAVAVLLAVVVHGRDGRAPASGQDDDGGPGLAAPSSGVS
jgi:hypothetical protein